MSAHVDVPSSPAPPAQAARKFILRLCTKNPFYVISAALFLLGLWISFPVQDEQEETWALMIGLTGYTLLLALTAFLLVRFGNVWDDVRTVLLLVVLMFLATSVTFDQVLATHPLRGFACYLGGLLFAIAVSEGILRGTGLILRGWFRLPYYVILSLFFLYPVALSPLLEYPPREELLWSIFSFSALAGLAFLTLLPAIRRGPDYVRDNGSPWIWPYYPWSLFVFLGVAVVGRAFLLCWSMHRIRLHEVAGLVFGPYFLVPFGLAVAVLLLEMGLVSRSRTLLRIALVLPLALAALTLTGHRLDDSVYRRFLGMFENRLGLLPLYAAILGATAFYAFAALRRVPLALEYFTVALAALAFVDPASLNRVTIVSPQSWPLVAIAILQLSLAWHQRSSWRGLVGIGALAVIASTAIADEFGPTPLRTMINFHLAVLVILATGAIFRDELAYCLRVLGGILVFQGCLAALFNLEWYLGYFSPWMVWVYPLEMAALLTCYGLLLRHWPSLIIAALIVPCWLARFGWEGYVALKKLVPGLDYIAISLITLVLAITMSLVKSMARSRRWFGGPADSV